MICRIAGTLEAVKGNVATLGLSGGVWREVLLPAYLAERMVPQTGRPVTLTTIEYLESPNQGASFIPRLVGFGSVTEREFFELFTTVKGIGTRKALRAMAVEPAYIARAIASKDAKGLQELPEIGKRLAETVIAELTGKVDLFLAPEELAGLEVKAGRAPRSPLADEAAAALVALGEQPEQAARRVARALERAAAAGHEPAEAGEILSLVYGAP